MVIRQHTPASFFLFKEAQRHAPAGSPSTPAAGHVFGPTQCFVRTLTFPLFLSFIVEASFHFCTSSQPPFTFL